MKEIIIKWCETNQLHIDDAIRVLIEYFSYSGRSITSQEIMGLLTISEKMNAPINWNMIMTQIALKNNLVITSVYSKEDSFGNRQLIKRNCYEE